MIDRSSIDSGLGVEQAKTEHRVIVESAAKFRFFFVGLVFAILSFAIQFPLKVADTEIKFAEVSSWGLLAITGLLALADIGGFSVFSEPTTRLTGWSRGAMWLCFLFGVVLLLVSKIWASFST